MAARAIVFDLDGTVWDSYPWYAALLSDLAGIPKDEVLRNLYGEQSIVKLVRDSRISRRSFTSAAVSAVDELSLYPNARQVLATLKRRGTMLGVFTSLPSDIAPPMLDALKLRSYFGEIIHAGNCRHSKPRPHGLHQAVEALGITAEDTVVYVGDRDVDAETARNAGVTFAWAAYGYGKKRPDFTFAELARFDQVLDL